MSRLATAFAELRARDERALVPYFPAGDPSLDETRRLCLEAVRRGADVLEIGVPFSDPLADGPVIQRAGQRALAAGVTLARVLELVHDLRAETAVPLVALTYYNPVLAFGLKAFAQAAVDAGLDGVIVADLPPEEADPLDEQARSVGLDLIHLLAPTSTPARMRLIARRSRGFIYVVSVTGVTGVREALPLELVRQLRALRLITRTSSESGLGLASGSPRTATPPICVGFGISTAEHVRTLAPYADGLIVGSALVRLVEQHAGSPRMVEEVGRLIESLKAPLRKRARA